MNIRENLRKFIRYVLIYGVGRAIIKSLSRIRPNIKIWKILKLLHFKKYNYRIAIIGCGQHSYSSIAYFLTVYTNVKIVFVYDKNSNASSSFARAYNSIDIDESEIDIFTKLHKPDLVYISSNHATHTDYAIKFMNYNCDVYIEKPISINVDQLNILTETKKRTNKQIYAGYNRPFSKSMQILKNTLITNRPLTISCFVIGHMLSDDHWYRDPREGSRIVSNVGHWIDLFVHILFRKDKMIEHINIMVTYTNKNLPSDNINISMTTELEDLFNITFTSRGETFEGVSEMINIQQDQNIIKIDDFRTTKVWKGKLLKKYVHWPKDNGHKNAVLEPFYKKINRSWDEIEYSTKLMLHIELMIKELKNNSQFKL